MFFPMNPMRPPHYDQYPYHSNAPYPYNPMYWQNPPYAGQQPYQHGMQQMPGVASNGRQPPYSNQPFGRPKSSISIMNAFKNEEGKFDFEKTSSTINQVMKVGNQISPLVKQVSDIFIKK